MQTTVGNLIDNLSQLDLSTVMNLPPSLSALIAGTTTPAPPAQPVIPTTSTPAPPAQPAIPTQPVATTAAVQPTEATPGSGATSPTIGTLPITAFAAVFRCPTCDAVHFMTPINNPPASAPYATSPASPNAGATVPAPSSTPAPATLPVLPSTPAPPPPSTPAPPPPSTPAPPLPSTPAPPLPSTPTPVAFPAPPSTPSTSFPSMSAASFQASTSFGTPPSTPRNAVASSSTAGTNGRWYSVTYGRQIGVFRDWYGIVEPLVLNVPGWKCKAFGTLAAATAHFNEHVNAGVAGIYVD